MYFNPDDGIPMLRFCFDCIDFYEYPNPWDVSCYHSPIPPPVDLEKLAIEKALNRSKLALYYLYDALESTSRSLNPGSNANSAMSIFHRNFPEFQPTTRW